MDQDDQSETQSGDQSTFNPLDPDVMRNAAQQVLADEETAIRNWIESNTDDLSSRILSGMPGLVAYVKQNAPNGASQADEQVRSWLSDWASNHGLVIPAFNVLGPFPDRTIAAPDSQHLGIDLTGDTRTYQVAYTILDAKRVAGGDCGPALEALQTQAGIQITPQPDNQYVAQAAVNALDLHLRNHCQELVEATLAAQGGVNLSSGSPSGAAQLQIELHLTTSFSIAASTSVNVSPSGGPPDPSTVPLGGGGGADLSWTPFTLNTLVHF